MSKENIVDLEGKNRKYIPETWVKTESKKSGHGCCHWKDINSMLPKKY
jgi:hypothetical protein